MFHPSFNREVRMVVFMVEDQGFKVDAVRLASHSEFLHNLLFDEGGLIGTDQEGTVDKPIELQGCSANAFANFLLWLDHCPWAPLVASHLDQLLDILHISHMWDIRPGVKFASDQLQEKHFNLSPAYSLKLARQYGLTHWIDKSVRTLLQTPLHTYSNLDKEHLGFDLYIVIAEAKDAISAERKRTGRYPPLPDFSGGPFCPLEDHKVCVKIWIEGWYMDIARRIHDAAFPLALSEIPAALDAMDHKGMKADCKEFILSWIQSSDHLRKEEVLIRRTVDRVGTFFA